MIRTFALSQYAPKGAMTYLSTTADHCVQRHESGQKNDIGEMIRRRMASAIIFVWRFTLSLYITLDICFTTVRGVTLCSCVTYLAVFLEPPEEKIEVNEVRVRAPSGLSKTPFVMVSSIC
jgi:hypothetical protein